MLISIDTERMQCDFIEGCVCVCAIEPKRKNEMLFHLKLINGHTNYVYGHFLYIYISVMHKQRLFYGICDIVKLINNYNNRINNIKIYGAKI